MFRHRYRFVVKYIMKLWTGIKFDRRMEIPAWTVLSAVVYQHLEIASKSVIVDSLKGAKQPRLLHETSINPEITRRPFIQWGQISNNGLATIKQLLWGLCHHTWIHLGSLNPQESQITGHCQLYERSVYPVFRPSVKYVNNYWKNCHNI